MEIHLVEVFNLTSRPFCPISSDKKRIPGIWLMFNKGRKLTCAGRNSGGKGVKKSTCPVKYLEQIRRNYICLFYINRR